MRAAVATCDQYVGTMLPPLMERLKQVVTVETQLTHLKKATAASKKPAARKRDGNVADAVAVLHPPPQQQLETSALLQLETSALLKQAAAEAAAEAVAVAAAAAAAATAAAKAAVDRQAEAVAQALAAVAEEAEEAQAREKTKEQLTHAANAKAEDVARAAAAELLQARAAGAEREKLLQGKVRTLEAETREKDLQLQHQVQLDAAVAKANNQSEKADLEKRLAVAAIEKQLAVALALAVSNRACLPHNRGPPSRAWHAYPSTPCTCTCTCACTCTSSHRITPQDALSASPQTEKDTHNKVNGGNLEHMHKLQGCNQALNDMGVGRLASQAVHSATSRLQTLLSATEAPGQYDQFGSHKSLMCSSSSQQAPPAALLFGGCQTATPSPPSSTGPPPVPQGVAHVMGLADQPGLVPTGMAGGAGLPLTEEQKRALEQRQARRRADDLEMQAIQARRAEEYREMNAMN